MRKLLAAAAIGIFLPCIALAGNGGTPQTTTNTATGATASSPLTLTIPALVGIDDQSDVIFDLANHYTPGLPTTCASNFWPVSAACNPASTYHIDPRTALNTYGTSTTTGLTSSSVAGDSAIWLAIFCSKAGAGLDVQGRVTLGGTFTNSGLNASNIKFKASGSNNAGIGNSGTFTAMGTSYASLTGASAFGTANSTFPWTRIDQAVALEFNAGTALTAGTYNATIEYIITKP